jgi:hypothetical protein
MDLNWNDLKAALRDRLCRIRIHAAVAERLRPSGDALVLTIERSGIVS